MKTKGLVAGALWAALVGLILIGPGCSKSSKKEAVPTQALTGDPSNAVATVNDGKVTLGEVNRLVAAWKAGQAQGVDPNTPLPQLQQKAVDELVNQELLYEEAVKKGMAPSPEEVKGAIDQIKKSFPDSTQYRQVLQQRGMSEADVLDGYRMSTAITRWMQSSVQDTINVTAAQVRAYFDSHPQDFQHPDQVHARHILALVDPNNPTPDKETAAKSKIDEVAGELKAGADFTKLAQERSDDHRTGPNGGDLGFFGRGQIFGGGAYSAALDSVVFSLQPGQTSPPLRSPAGWHIIRVEEKRPAGMYKFEDVQAVLMQRLKSMRTSSAVESVIATLKAKAKIKRKI